MTSTNFTLARYLVESLQHRVTVDPERDIQQVLPHDCIHYSRAVERAFTKIAENAVLSSWKDAWITTQTDKRLDAYVEVPEYGCLVDKQVRHFERPTEEVIDNVLSIGGNRGWYFMNWAWGARGLLDNLIGGVGLRRGRTHPTELRPGDSLDFWRVLRADKETGHLILYAEMLVPGEAWLEFKLEDKQTLVQKATFRPYGLAGRAYWYVLYIPHWFIFRGMIRNVVNYRLT